MRSVHILALAALIAGAPAASAHATSAAPAAFDQPDSAFKEKLKKAVAAGKKDVETLVKSDTTQAAAWILRIGEVLLDRDDPNEKPLHAALVEGWNAAVKTGFPARMEAYLKGLDERSRRTRSDLRKRLAQAGTDLEVNREGRDPLLFAQLADELDILASAFESEGDHYSASETHLLLAETFDEAVRGTDADPHKAWKHWTRAVELRAQIELEDGRAVAARKRAAELAKKGHDKEGGPAVDEPEKGKGGKGAKPGKAGEVPAGPAGPPQEAGNPVAVALEFEPIAHPEAYARPCFQADEVYALWNPVQLGAKGTSATFAQLGADSPVLHRLGSADLRFDVDGDGKADGPADLKIVVAGTLTPFRIQIGKGDAARPWAFFAATGIDRDAYQGLEVNLQPNDQAMPIYTLSAASVVGTIGTTHVRILDDTMDGVYGSEVQTYGYAGLSNGSYQPELDSIVIGDAKRARPWSQYQQIGGSWWKLEGGSKGKELLATPASVTTGTLKLEVKGAAPTWVVVRGANELKDCFFDLVEGGSKGVTVPAGRYTLFYGEVRKGKKRQVQKAVILPSRTATNYDVRPGQTTVVTLGAPYSFDYVSVFADGKVKIQGATVVVTGVGGERYERVWNAVTRPEVAWRKKGQKKAAGSARMAVIADTETLYERGNQGWLDVWFPLDLELEAKGADAVEIHLSDDKHKLFGKVESPWKE
ncbi:MAG: hypothetical protein JNK02_13525 [Planctomycetes bacterium]|nr:hypothetical protein [Planctomycetota bacterium]